MKNCFKCFIVFALLLPYFAHANKLEEKVRHKQLDYQKDLLEKKTENNVKFKSGIDTEKEYEERGVLEEGVCFNIHSIELKGATLLSKREKKELIEPFLNKCLGISTLKESLLANIKYMYNKKGYVLVIPYLPNQNIQDGTVEVLIEEGYLEDFFYNEKALKAREINLAFFNSKGKPVNLRFAEQALENMNTRNDYSITMSFVPGKEVGSTVVFLQEQAKKKPKYSYSFEFTNDYNTVDDKDTSYEPNRYQLTLKSANSLLPNDNWSTFANFDNDIKNPSGTLGVFYSLPFGYWSINFDASVDAYKDTISTQSQDVTSEGVSSSISLELQRTVFRNKSNIIKGFTKANFYISNNYLDDIHLQASSYNITYLDVGVSTQTDLQSFYISTSQKISYGYPIFGDEKQGRNDYFYPQNVFTIYSADGSITKFLTSNIYFESKLSFQYTKDTLFSTKDFNAIGSQSVRGYEGIYSDYGSGFSAQNNLNIFLYSAEDTNLKKVKLILGYDIGGSLDENNLTILGYKGQAIQGWFSGLELSYRMLNVKASLAGPIFTIPELDKNHIVFNFSIGVANF